MASPAKAVRSTDERVGESLASLALDAIAAGVLVVDQGGRVLHASSPVARLLGGEVRDLAAEVAQAGEMPRREVVSALLEACTGWEEVHRLITFDRERRHYFYLSAAPHEGKDGKRRIVALVMDLTDVVLQGDMAAEFIRQARHDMRGPLTSIQGGVELLLTERLGRLEERQRKLLHIMVKGIQSMVTILSGGPGTGSISQDLGATEHGKE